MNASELARKERVLIDLDIKKSEAERQKQLSLIKAEREVSVKKTQAQAALETETSNAKADVELLLKRQMGEGEAAKIQADQVALTEKIRSEAALTEAINRARAIALQAEAEEKVYKQLGQKREFDLQMASVKALQKLASKGKIVISGQNGRTIIDSITKGTPMLTLGGKKEN